MLVNYLMFISSLFTLFFFRLLLLVKSYSNFQNYSFNIQLNLNLMYAIFQPYIIPKGDIVVNRGQPGGPVVPGVFFVL